MTTSIDKVSVTTDLEMPIVHWWSVYQAVCKVNHVEVKYIRDHIVDMVGKLSNFMFGLGVVTPFETKLFKVCKVNPDHHTDVLFVIEELKKKRATFKLSIDDMHIIIMCCRYATDDPNQYPYVRVQSKRVASWLIKRLGSEYQDMYTVVFGGKTDD